MVPREYSNCLILTDVLAKYIVLLLIQEQSIVMRPGFGKAGRKVTIQSNHFRMTCSLEEAYQYDLTIVPKRVTKSGEEIGNFKLMTPFSLCVILYPD